MSEIYYTQIACNSHSSQSSGLNTWQDNPAGHIFSEQKWLTREQELYAVIK